MKMFIVSLTIGIALSLQAKASTCFNKISAINGIPEITSTQLACIKTKNEFAELAASLCNENHRELSSKYTQYLSYQKKYQIAFDAYSIENVPSKKAQLLARVTQADELWMLAGYRGEIDYALLQLSAALTGCTAN